MSQQGSSVTALIVPKNLGYAGIAQVPLQNGLYAAAAGAIVYALFCTSRQISTGPSSSLAAVAGGAVLAAGARGAAMPQSWSRRSHSSPACSSCSLAVFRLGRIAQFLSKAVVHRVSCRRRDRRHDRRASEAHRHRRRGCQRLERAFCSWIAGPSMRVHWTTVLVGVHLPRRDLSAFGSWRPKVPGALVLVVGGLVASGIFDLGSHGVALVGDVPRGLAGTGAAGDPRLRRLTSSTICTASFALLLIGFSQTAGDARLFATRHRYRIDVNQESLAQGMANAAAGTFQGMPVSTSLSASSLNESAGARTRLRRSSRVGSSC